MIICDLLVIGIVRLNESRNLKSYVTVTSTGHNGVAVPPTQAVAAGQVATTLRPLASMPVTIDRT
jgi:hypothetical protein